MGASPTVELSFPTAHDSGSSPSRGRSIGGKRARARKRAAEAPGGLRRRCQPHAHGATPQFPDALSISQRLRGSTRTIPLRVLMTVADLSTAWVTAQVSEKDIQRVKLGEDARVVFTAYPEEPFQGRVAVIGDVLVPETRTVKVRIKIANEDHRLKPGMFARRPVRPGSSGAGRATRRAAGARQS